LEVEWHYEEGVLSIQGRQKESYRRHRPPQHSPEPHCANILARVCGTPASAEGYDAVKQRVAIMAGTRKDQPAIRDIGAPRLVVPACTRIDWDPSQMVIQDNHIRERWVHITL
jgi:hypothetical protein